MKKIVLLLLLAFSVLGLKAQTTYQLNYDSIRVNKTAGTGGTSLYGKVYLKNVGSGLVSDSILTVLNGRIRKIPNLGSTNYIQNQIAGAQSSSNFWLSGVGRAPTLKATSQLFVGQERLIDTVYNTSRQLMLRANRGDSSVVFVVRQDYNGIGSTRNLAGINVQAPDGAGDFYQAGMHIYGSNYNIPWFKGKINFTNDSGRGTILRHVATNIDSARVYILAGNTGENTNDLQMEIAGGASNSGPIAMGTSLDAAYKLSVGGSVKVTGGITTATASNLATSSGSVGIGTASPLSKVHIRTGVDQNIRFRPGTDVGGANGVAINTRTDDDSALQELSIRASNINFIPSGSVNISTLGSSGDVLTSVNNSGNLGKVTIGSGLSLTAGVLTATGGSSGTVTTAGGTAGIIAKFTSASNIENSVLTESGGNLSATGTMTATSFSGAGTGLTGTASGLSIGGSAATLTTTRTIWGQNFNGSANVSGALSGATTGVFSSSLQSNHSIISESGQSVVLQGYTGGLRLAVAGSGATGGTRANLVAASGDFESNVTVADEAYSSDWNSSVQVPTKNAVFDRIQLKADIANPTFTGTVSGITAAMVGAPSGSGTSTGTNTGDQNLAPYALTSSLGTAAFTASTAYRPSSYVPSWTEVTSKPTFSSVATSGAYGDLSGTPTLTSGTYTPTLTNVLNVSGGSNDGNAQYTRVGNTVTVYGSVSFTQTTTGNSLIGISLPIASNFTANTQAHGMGVSFKTVSTNGVISSDITNDRVSLSFVANSADTQTFRYSFMYQVL